MPEIQQKGIRVHIPPGRKAKRQQVLKEITEKRKQGKLTLNDKLDMILDMLEELLDRP